MEKRVIKQQVVWQYCGKNQPRFKDLKALDLEDDDLIYVGLEEDESGGSEWLISVEQERQETDEELATRVRRDQLNKEESDRKRYQRYLELKAEFEKDLNN
jgi:hypothetical protein